MTKAERAYLHAILEHDEKENAEKIKKAATDALENAMKEDKKHG